MFHALLAIIVVLTIASTIAVGALYFLGWEEDSFGYNVVKLFWLGSEQNIPTLYQCSVMLTAAVLFALLGARYRARGMPSSAWHVLAVAFAFLAVDEFGQVHENIGERFGTSYGASWAFFYIPFVLALGAWLLPFVWRLPGRIRALLILSGALYLGGSVGVEMIAHAYARENGEQTPVFAGLATLEEVLEKVAVALLVFALLDHLRKLRPVGEHGRTSRLVAVSAADGAAGRRRGTDSPSLHQNAGNRLD